MSDSPGGGDEGGPDPLDRLLSWATPDDHSATGGDPCANAAIPELAKAGPESLDEDATDSPLFHSGQSHASGQPHSGPLQTETVQAEPVQPDSPSETQVVPAPVQAQASWFESPESVGPQSSWPEPRWPQTHWEPVQDAAPGHSNSLHFQQAEPQSLWPAYQWGYYAAPRPVQPRRPPRTAPGWLGLALVAALVGAVVGGGVVAFFASRAPKTIVREYFGGKPGKVQVGDIQSILASVLPAVVSIDTSDIRGLGGYVQGAGTGMIIEPSGVILTNNHVIAGAQSVTVTFFGQSRPFPARVIGVDAQKDIALVQVEGARDPLPVVQLGPSGGPQQGDGVLAIGNALALAGGESVTEGIVSALDRSLTATTDEGATESLTGLIQTDAPINPGNSGGPLVDAAGQVVGMNTAVATSSQGNAPAENVGFAITMGEIRTVVAQILHHPVSS